MRWVIVRVLPVPAPARMQTGPETAWAAVRCSSSSPASTASARVCAPASVPIAVIGPPRRASSAPILPAGADVPGKHPQDGRVDLGTDVHHPRRGVDPPAPTMEDRPDDLDPDGPCHDVHHVVVRLLRPAQAPDAD